MALLEVFPEKGLPQEDLSYQQFAVPAHKPGQRTSPLAFGHPISIADLVPFDHNAYLQKRLQGKVIDIGSGGLDEFEGIEGVEAFYIDKTYHQQRNFRCIDVGNELLPFPDGYFDGVYSGNAFWTQPDAEAIIPESLRVLKPGKPITLCFCYEDQRHILEALTSSLVVLQRLGVDMKDGIEIDLVCTIGKHSMYPTYYLTAKK